MRAAEALAWATGTMVSSAPWTASTGTPVGPARALRKARPSERSAERATHRHPSTAQWAAKGTCATAR